MESDRIKSDMDSTLPHFNLSSDMNTDIIRYEYKTNVLNSNSHYVRSCVMKNCTAMILALQSNYCCIVFRNIILVYVQLLGLYYFEIVM